MRAPQRGRNGLRAFYPDLRPALPEVGIDRFSLTVRGNWRSTATASDDLTPEQYFALLTPPWEPSWFRVEQPHQRLVIRTLANAATTLGKVHLTIGRQSHQGEVVFKLTGNVVRTLHHLLVSHASQGADFGAYIDAIDPVTFFSRAAGTVPLALGDADNWISDLRSAHNCLGPDPFAAFLPIYIRQLKRMVAWLCLPVPSTIVTDDGGQLLASVPGLSCRFDWERVHVGDAEAFFERRHTHALGAVRLLGSAALSDFDNAEMRRYISNTSVWAERGNDNLSVGFALNQRYRIAIYAKSPSRIRFEMRRKGPGVKPPEAPETRLLRVLEMERQQLVDYFGWPAIGSLLDEHPAPQMSDLVSLCNAVHRISVRHSLQFHTLLNVLLTDGGIRTNTAFGWTDEVIADLCSAGIVQRTTLRRQDHRRPNKRYALRPEYRGMVHLVTRSLIEGRGLVPERS